MEPFEGSPATSPTRHTAPSLSPPGGPTRRLDLLVNNASELGPSPPPLLADYPLDELRHVLDVNVSHRWRLIQAGAAAAACDSRRTVVNITSDAAVEGYAGWGGYGSSKAALEQLSNVLAAEEPDVRVYWFDPGDMRTAMHQAAFPGDDISDRPLPETVVPAFRGCSSTVPPSRRFHSAELAGGPSHDAGVRRRRCPSPPEQSHRLSFDLPERLEAAEPPEARGLTRDGVRMLVAERATGRLVHTTFASLPSFLEPGDLVVDQHVGSDPGSRHGLGRRR